jgi:N-acyl-D-amino-acid deacylase
VRTVLRGASLADGLASQLSDVDVVVDNDLITDLVPRGELYGSAAQVELAPGSVIVPGFLDMHVHAERPILDAGVLVPALRQGVTTVVLGQDGLSWIGSDAATSAMLTEYAGAVNGTAPDGGTSVAEFVQQVERRLAHNVVVLASHGTLRAQVAGTDRRSLTPGELDAVRRLVDRALSEGARGVSSGFDYVPGRYGDVGELVDILRPLQAVPDSAVYMSHLRGYGQAVAAGLDELYEVAAGSGAKVHASHLWGPRELVEPALARSGRQVAADRFSYDVYPYTVASSLLSMLLLPKPWQENGLEAIRDALRSPGAVAGLTQHLEDNPSLGTGVILANLPVRYEGLAGASLNEAAERTGIAPAALAIEILLVADLRVGAHQQRTGFTDDDVRWLLRHPAACAGSDGIYEGQRPHPRGWASFAEFAARLTDATGSVDYCQVANTLSYRPAQVLGLTDRGHIAVGKVADLAVIGPDGLSPRATFADPCQEATGVSHVYVAGQPVIADGRLTGATPGRVLALA